MEENEEYDWDDSSNNDWPGRTLIFAHFTFSSISLSATFHGFAAGSETE
jgi:hypothetical protein